jgi:hypothetical protein
MSPKIKVRLTAFNDEINVCRIVINGVTVYRQFTQFISFILRFLCPSWQLKSSDF